MSLQQPFVEEDYFLAKYFLDRHWAILIPSLLLITFITIVTLFIGITLYKSANKKKKSA